jgi:para-aminobenzoate synthetase
LSLHAECIDTAADAEAVFMSTFAQRDCVFWLDSNLAEPGRARFSFMGDASGPRAQVLNYRTAPRELMVRRGDVVQVRDESIFDYLRDHLPGQPPAGPPASLRLRVWLRGLLPSATRARPTSSGWAP